MRINVLIFFIFILILLSIPLGLYTLVQSTDFWEEVITSLLKEAGDASDKYRVEIGKVYFQWPDRFLMRDIAVAGTRNEEAVSIQLEFIMLELSVFKQDKEKQITYGVKLKELKTNEFAVNEGWTTGTIHIFGKGVTIAQGSIHVRGIRWQDYALNDLRCHNFIKRTEFRVDNCSAGFYDGVLRPRLTMIFLEDNLFTFEALFADINTEILERQKLLESPVKGVFHGSIRVEGRSKAIHNVSVDMHIPRDGKVQADLLKQLIHYLPDIAQKDYLLEQLENRTFVRMQTVDIRMDNPDTQTLTTRFGLKSREVPMDLDLAVDFQLNTTVDKAIKHRLITQQGGGTYVP